MKRERAYEPYDRDVGSHEANIYVGQDPRYEHGQKTDNGLHRSVVQVTVNRVMAVKSNRNAMIMEYSMSRRPLIKMGMNNIVVAGIHNKVSDAVGRQNINI